MNPHIEYELFTQMVYQKLVNNDVLKPTEVKHNVKLEGKSGRKHQIDVYWEYEIADNLHRVAIECKNYNSLVPISKVRDFQGVLCDLNNVNGIMVSRRGFHEGAKKYAAEYGISLKELRRPEQDESIGSITSTIHASTRRILFLIDDSWIMQNGLTLDIIRQPIVRFSIKKSNYWKTANYLPLETKDNYIRDSNDKIISSFEELEKQLPGNPESGSTFFFPFEDGWLDSRRWGRIKIREVKFEYESEVQITTLNLSAHDFVEAILKDALNGKTEYVPKC